MKSKWIGLAMACAVLAACAATVQADPPPLTVWGRQIGTSGRDYGYGIAVDGSGNTYITGATYGDLGGPNQGAMDAFIVACDSEGTAQWATQIGSSATDRAFGIALDGSGNIYITGKTYGDLGGPNEGGGDAFVVKYDSGGTLQWTRQLGTSEEDYVGGIGVDASGNSYITGYTSGDLGGSNQGGTDAFIVKYDSGGTQQWIRQIETSDTDYALGIAVDGSGNNYITGYTYGNLGGPNQGSADAFIVKYDSGGTEQWTRQIGTSDSDCGFGIGVDGSGNIYITGSTLGDLGGPNQGRSDAFIVKYDTGGTVQWTRQIGSIDVDLARRVTLDGSGNIYITGGTFADLGGPDQGGLSDAVIVAYDSAGTVQWTRQLGTGGEDWAWGIAVDGNGNIYITGETFGDLAGPNQGGDDAFIMAIGTTPATAGDSNVDGCTDGLDYAIWSNYYEPFVGGKTWQHGDSNEDGVVDGLDYVIWSNNYEQGYPGQVPEPSCALLLALGFLALRRRFGA